MTNPRKPTQPVDELEEVKVQHEQNRTKGEEALTRHKAIVEAFKTAASTIRSQRHRPVAR